MLGGQAGRHGLVPDIAKGGAVRLDKGTQQEEPGNADHKDQNEGRSGKPQDKAFQEPHVILIMS